MLGGKRFPVRETAADRRGGLRRSAFGGAFATPTALAFIAALPGCTIGSGDTKLASESIASAVSECEAKSPNFI